MSIVVRRGGGRVPNDYELASLRRHFNAVRID